MSVTNTTQPGSQGGPQGWAAGLDEPVQRILQAQGCEYRAHDRVTAHFQAIPLGMGFNKPRTNLLLRLVHPTAEYAGIRAFVDSDLAYAGPDPRLRVALTGVPCEQNWRLLSTPGLSRGLSRALGEVLDLLRSPLAKPVCEALGVVPRATGETERPPLPPLLTALAAEVRPDEAKTAWDTCFRGELATDVAITLTRPVEPASALISSPEHGTGCDHVALAAVHRLLESGIALRAVRLSGAAVVAGFWTQSEAEGNLRKVLAEAVGVGRRHATVLVLQDLDFVVKAPVGRALLSRAMDDGLRFIGVLRHRNTLDELRDDRGLWRRLQRFEVPAPSEAEVLESLKHLAGRSGVPVAPAAMRAAMTLVRKDAAINPAGALALLGASIAEAAWHGRPEVLPDDVVSVHQRHFGPSEE